VEDLSGFVANGYPHFGLGPRMTPLFAWANNVNENAKKCIARKKPK
jgi:hypothetical protein